MRKGFTLIELLIVIAIIAILALIAVPNFLETQVRAKVTRVYSDMRALSVAYEAYAVDWGRHPIGKNEGIAMNLWLGSQNDWLYNFITTPVAYMTSIPRDPLIKSDLAGSRKAQKHFTYQTYNSGIFIKKGYQWLMYCPGPDGDVDSPWFRNMLSKGHPNNIYDATNGTMSNGSIWWTNKGRFFKPD